MLSRVETAVSAICARSCAYLESRGQLTRIGGRSSVVHEMTEIHRRVLAAGGPALLFEQAMRADGKRRRCRCWSICSAPWSGWPRASASLPRASGELGEVLAAMREPAPVAGSEATR